jgi:hypothetical protein
MRASRIRWLPALGAGLALAACDGGTPFDPVALSQTAAEVLAALENGQASQSMAVLGPKMTVAAPALVAATMPNTDLLTGSPNRWAQRRAEMLQRAAGEFSPESPAVIFPVDVLGKTFTYNTTTQTYQLSSETGAPSNGVRFRLYAVNTTTQQVNVPLQDIGYLELTDKSTPAAVSLGIKAVVNNVTLLDYTASATIATTGVSFSALGFVSDGTTRVDFDLKQSFSQTAGISIDYTVEVPESNVGVRLQASLNLQLVGSITLTINHGGNNTVIDVTGSLDGAISGTIEHNGDVVVNISGTSANPVFTDATGTPLTPQQLDALENLVDFIEDILDAFDNLLYPAYGLLGINL